MALFHEVELKNSYTKAKMIELLLPVVKDQFQEEWKKTTSIEKEGWLNISSTDDIESP